MKRRTAVSSRFARRAASTGWAWCLLLATACTVAPPPAGEPFGERAPQVAEAPAVADDPDAERDANVRPRPKYEDLARYTAPLDRYADFRRGDFSVLRRQAVPDSALPRKYAAPWKSVGPADYAGKVMDLDVHPTDANVVFAAYGSGGIWRTTDGGASWRQVTDIESQNYTATVKILDADPSYVYAGLGHPAMNLELERGVLVSDDGGDTWKAIGPVADDARAVYRIAVAHDDPDTIFAATERAVYRTRDGGESWERVLQWEGENWWDHLPDMVMHPTDPTVLWVAKGKNGLVRTSDGGDSWQKADKGIDPGQAIVLTVYDGNPNLLYAQRILDSWPETGIYKSTDGGKTWSRVTVLNRFHQGRYDLSIAVNPVDPNDLVVANVSWARSSDGGKTFSDYGWTAGNEPSSRPHADHLRVHFADSNPSVIWNGNDAGVYRSTDGGKNWHKRDFGVRSNLSFDLGIDPKGKKIYLTSGDYYPGQVYTGSIDWSDFPGYEWQFYEADPFDSKAVYFGDIGRLRRTLDGGVTVEDIDPARHEPFTRPKGLEADPSTPGRIYVATTRLYRSDDRGTTWTPVSPYLAQDPNWGITDFAIAPTDPDVIYIITGSWLWMTDNGGADWTRVSETTPYQETVVVSPKDPGTFYVGAVWDQFRYTGFGAKKIRINSNLPNVPVRRLAIDPKKHRRIVAATDIGIFISDNVGKSWQKLGTELPRVLFWDVGIRGKLVYAAGQQGVWSYDLRKRR